MSRRKSRRRNPVACSPLMRKGGAHIESKTGQRVKQRHCIKKAINEWKLEVETARSEDEKGEQSLPFFLRRSDSLIYK